MNVSDDIEDLPYVGTWELGDVRLSALSRKVLTRIPDELESDFPVINVLLSHSPWGAPLRLWILLELLGDALPTNDRG